MLKRFLYLDERAVGQYVSQLEDGVRQTQERTAATSGEGGAQLGINSTHAGAKTTRREEKRWTGSDTPEAQLERLLRFASANSEDLDWLTVTQPDVELQEAKVGTFVELDAEVFIPSTLKAFSSGGQFGQIADMISAFQSLGPGFQAQMPTGAPDMAQIRQLGEVAKALQGNQAFVGEPDSDTWKVAGPLNESSIRDEVDGPARVLGKVSQIVASGGHKMLLTLPGSNLMSRAQRRDQEKKGPAKPDDDSWISGPALILDVLAIYR